MRGRTKVMAALPRGLTHCFAACAADNGSAGAFRASYRVPTRLSMAKGGRTALVALTDLVAYRRAGWRAIY